MSAKDRAQFLGRIQIVLGVMLVFASGWFLHRLWGGLFSVLVFVGTIFWASYYLFAMYDLDSRADAFVALLTFMFRIDLPRITIAEGRTKKTSKASASKLGGPGVFVINNDSAVVTESGTRARVFGPGVHFVTKRSEAIKEIIDLRPQMRTDTVKAMTKDGVDIEIPFFVGFQISSGGREPSEEEPYPFAERALLRAVYRSKQVDSQGAKLWHERIPGIVYANVREMIASHYLKDFFAPDSPHFNPRTDMKDWLFDTSRGPAEAIGVKLNWVNFGTPQIPNEVIRKFFDTWRTKKWDAAVQVQDSRLKADRLKRLANSLKDAGLSDDTIRAILSQVFAPTASHNTKLDRI